jgi:O-acetyl-ADP-ribose deacetylase (regulator of RNase III)
VTDAADAGAAAGLTVRTGNLLASPADALVCPTNTVGSMGAGLARAFAHRFPGLERDYRAACQRGEVRLGRVWRWATLLPPVVLCLPTKGHHRDGSRRRDIDQGLTDLTARVGEWGIGSLAVPALGCGLGGLAWHQIAPLLRRHLAPLSIRVEVYAPQEMPVELATAVFLADPGLPAARQTARAVRGSPRGVPAGAVYVGRAWPRAGLAASPLANPFRLEDPHDPSARRRSLERYRDWLHTQAAQDGAVGAELERVRGRDLACWCAPQPCHADVVLAWLLRHPAAGDPVAASLAEQLAVTEAALPPSAATRLAVVGSKRFGGPAAWAIARLIVLDELLRLRPEVVVSGGAVGLDRLAGRLARQLGLHPPDRLVEHLPVPIPDPPAGMRPFEAKGYRRRDQLIAETCTALLRVWSRFSRTYGSGWTADQAARLGRPVGRVML